MESVDIEIRKDTKNKGTLIERIEVLIDRIQDLKEDIDEKKEHPDNFVNSKGVAKRKQLNDLFEYTFKTLLYLSEQNIELIDSYINSLNTHEIHKEYISSSLNSISDFVETQALVSNYGAHQTEIMSRYGIESVVQNFTENFKDTDFDRNTGNIENGELKLDSFKTEKVVDSIEDFEMDIVDANVQLNGERIDIMEKAIEFRDKYISHGKQYGVKDLPDSDVREETSYNVLFDNNVDTFHEIEFTGKTEDEMTLEEGTYMVYPNKLDNLDTTINFTIRMKFKNPIHIESAKITLISDAELIHVSYLDENNDENNEVKEFKKESNNNEIATILNKSDNVLNISIDDTIKELHLNFYDNNPESIKYVLWRK